MVNMRTQIQSKIATNNSDANAGSGKICLNVGKILLRVALCTHRYASRATKVLPMTYNRHVAHIINYQFSVDLT